MIEPAVDDTETSLIVRAASGEPQAAKELLDLTGPMVYGFVFARVGGRQDAAEDLVQATYLEAMRSAHQFRGDAALSTWLCAIARHQVSRYYKTERRRARLESKLLLISDEVTEEISDEDAFADADAVITALGKLTALHRQVLVMKYLDDLSVEEIARDLGRSKVQVQSLLQRARARLKRVLGETADD